MALRFWPRSRPAEAAAPPAPSVPTLGLILETVAGQPRTPAELARRLGTTPEALAGMLRTLHTGGYVQEAAQGQGACACGPCALKSLCRNAGDETPPLHLLRLTARGEAYLTRLEGRTG